MCVLVLVLQCAGFSGRLLIVPPMHCQRRQCCARLGITVFRYNHPQLFFVIFCFLVLFWGIIVFICRVSQIYRFSLVMHCVCVWVFTGISECHAIGMSQSHFVFLQHFGHFATTGSGQYSLLSIPVYSHHWQHKYETPKMHCAGQNKWPHITTATAWNQQNVRSQNQKKKEKRREFEKRIKNVWALTLGI